nr:protein kinase-like domain, concanavalin A-like lectin/glucanase domain protein [Tanacetum cinerariifolium]
MCLERFNNNPAPNTTHTNVLTSCQFKRTEPRKKEVIKSPTKLLALKYQEQPSSLTIDKKSPPLRRVYFVNTITLVKKERESRDTTLREHEGLTSKVDDEVGSNKFKEKEEDDLEYFNTFPAMKELEHYKQIISQKLESRQKPSNPCKKSNFVGRVRSLKVFVGNFTYKCDFIILEDTTSIIDHDLGEIAFGKPIIEQTGLAYDNDEGMIVFRENDEKIMFEMPHRMDVFEHIDLKDMNTDPISPIVLDIKYEHGKVYYSKSLIIGPGYKQNESVSKEIRCLIKLEREARNKNRGVT